VLLRVLSTVAVPLRLFTNLAFIVGGIWTLLLAEWDVLLTAIAAALFAHFLLALALAPGLMLAFPAGRFLERGNKPVAYFFLLGWPVHVRRDDGVVRRGSPRLSEQSRCEFGDPDFAALIRRCNEFV
jgi:hypothetical protein